MDTDLQIMKQSTKLKPRKWVGDLSPPKMA